MAKFLNAPNILWKIENFASTNKILSPIISFNGLKWQLSFSQIMVSNGSLIQLVLECLTVSEDLPTFQFKADVYFLRDDGNRHHGNNGEYNFNKDTVRKEWCIWSVSVGYINKILGSADSITFSITITPCGDFETLFPSEKNSVKTNEISPCITGLCEDLEKIFKRETQTDFVLKCNNRSFRVHKPILCARSDFFAGLCGNDMKEANEGTGIIENLEPYILEHVLRYLYTGNIPQLPMESIRKIYAAADMLLIEPLKVKCYSLLIDNFTIDNKDNSKEDTKTEENSQPKQSEIKNEESSTNKERLLLKDVFMSREWRLFSQEFPHRAQEMSKMYLLNRQ